MQSSDVNPEIFEIEYGYDSNYKITYENQEIVFCNHSEGIELSLKPSQEEWKKFWEIMEEIQIWSWSYQYEYESLGEIQWRLKMKIDDKEIDSQGIHAYPADNMYSRTPYMSLIFEKFINALEELTNQKIETYEEQSEPELFPDYLSIYHQIEMEPYPSESYYFQGNQIFYSNDDPEINSLAAKPTSSQWQVFWEKLDDLGVWGWKEFYDPDIMILDGSSWNVKICYGTKKIESKWLNCSNDDLKQLLESVKELMH